MSRVDKFIFLSEYLSEKAADVIPKAKRVVIHNPIDDEVRFTEEECKQKISQRAAENSLNILFISNMIESKGYWDLAKALLQLPSHIKWDAHFVGDWGNDNQRKNFEKYLLDNGILERTIVYGKVSVRSVIKEMYRKADIFVLPTYYPVEAQPLTIIEAMNAAMPIIATPHASIPEYVKNDYNGYLVTKKSPDEIAVAIENLTNRKRWSEFAMASRETYLELFSTEAIQKKIIDLFTG